MSENHNKEKLVQSFFSACKNGVVDKVKELLPQFLSFYEDNYEAESTLFQNACLHGKLNVLKCFVDNPNFLHRINDKDLVQQTIYLLIDDYNECLNPVISYLLNETRLTKSKDFHAAWKWSLQHAARKDNLPLFKVFLNADNDFKQAKVLLNTVGVFESGCRNSDPQVLKYLYSDPQISLLIDPEDGFKSACFYKNDELLKFIIFEYQIEKSEEIKKFMQEVNSTIAEKLFQARELNQELNIQLDSNQTTNKKMKV